MKIILGKKSLNMSNNQIYLCAISNIESGTCNEDCKFCTQSVKYKANIERYRRKEIEQIVEEAKRARANKAVGFCLVTAGTGLDDKRLDYVCRAADAVHKAVPDISIIACNGLATFEQLKELKKHGVENYNHNLETAREFYNTICTTHSWDDRYNTCLDAKKLVYIYVQVEFLVLEKLKKIESLCLNQLHLWNQCQFLLISSIQMKLYQL